MDLYRNILIVLTLLGVTVHIHAGSNNSREYETHTEFCPRDIRIHSKRFFEAYLKIWGNGSTSGIFPPLLIENVSAVCCEGQKISIRFMNETSRLSVQKLLYNERERRERGQTPFDNRTLDFYFPAYTTKPDATEVYKEFAFVEVVKSPGPAFVVLVSQLEDSPDPTVVLIECWPIFVLLLVMAWVVGIIGWFLVSILVFDICTHVKFSQLWEVC
jgi:hypothetical protein